MAPPPAPVRKPRRWLRRLAILLVLAAVGLWFAPAIATRAGLPNRIARDALAEFRGTVEVGDASLGWFEPVELHDVVVKDAQGRTLLTVPRITSTKSLFDLARDRADLGTFTLERPVAEVHFENGSTNLEQSLEAYLKAESPAVPTRPAVSVVIANGTCVLHDAGRQSRLESLDASIGIPASRTEPIQVAVKAGSPGSLDAALAIGDTGSAKVNAVKFPLETLAPLVKRIDASTTLAGTLTANLNATWGKDSAAVEGAAAVHNLDLTAAWLNGDRLKLATAELPIKASLEGHTLHLDRADLSCDAGTLSASGTFDPDQSLDKLLNHPGISIRGDLDLAKAAAIVPRLLRVREGTAIRNGRLIVALNSRAVESGAAWDGEVRASELKAERAGKPIEWAEPFTIEFSGRVPAGKLPTFDKFICQSDFIAISAKGSPESFRAAANVYLDRLASRLGEFVDLRGLTLTGEGTATLIANHEPDGAFKASAGLELKQFAFASEHWSGIREPALSLKATAGGLWPAGGEVRLNTATLDLHAGVDRAELTLLEPIPDVRKPAAGTLSAKVTGDLSRWMKRVRGFVRIPNYEFGGDTVATGTVRFTQDRTSIDRLTLGIDRAKFRGAGLDLNEPRMDASADLSVTDAAVQFTRFRITSAVLNVADGTLTIETPADGNTAVGGNGDAATDLERLGLTLKLASDPKGNDALRGRATGPFRFRWQGDSATFGGTLAVKDFTYGDPKTTGISEPALNLDLDARYELTADRLNFTRAKLDRSGLAVDAKGTFAKLDSTQDVNLDGMLVYDLAKLSPDLRQSFGGGFQAAGRGTRSFSLHGSLGGAKPNLFAKLTADAGIGWDSVKAYGFNMGPGEFTVKLANGKADISPIRANFGEGKIAISPAARFDPEPAEFTLAKGKIVDRAKLTPAVTAGALGYALPMIANAAQANGELSFILADNRIPLADVTKSTVKGQIVVHKATIGPGPVITEIMKATGSTNTVLTLADDMTVPVRIEGGRVYHENFSITVNRYAIRTSGSVGFDGSLALIAEVPIPDTLPALKNNPVLKKALEGKIVKLPLTGTVEKPTLDPNLFAASVAGLTRDAMKDIGKGLLKKELDKLLPFGPKK